MNHKINEFLKKFKYSKLIFTTLFLIILIILYIDHGNSKIISKNNAISVLSSKAEIKVIPIYIAAIGTVTPNYTANIQAQVSGRILKVNFRDGQKVKKNEVLVEIDPSLYKAQVKQYEGQLARDKALLDNALIDLQRYKELWKENSISNQTLATQVALVNQYKGTVKMDEGYLDNALVNLNFCNIKAPFDGEMGIALLTAGALVDSSSNIAVINVRDPISVLFNVQDVELQTILEEFNKKGKLSVEAYNRNKTTIASIGELTAVNNQINVSTGTIQLKAIFNNKDLSLFPNQFVNIKLLIKNLENAITVPVEAIQYGPNGAFVYKIVDEKAILQLVDLELIVESNAVIKSGIEEGQLVVISGGDRLIDGSLVTVDKASGN